MQVFYLSHPFTGNEEKNRIETTKLMQLLGSTFPQYVFLSPIDAMKPMEHLLDYDTILSQTLELLKRCDGIILTGRWQESNGCQAEYDLAKKLCLSISFGVAGFYQQYGAEKGQKKGAGRKAWYRKDRYGSYVIVWAKTEMEAKALLDDACPGEPPGTPSRLPWADSFHSDKERAFQYEAMKHGFGYACAACQTIITWKDVQRSGTPAVYRNGAWYCPACAYDLEKKETRKDTKGEVR